MKKATLLVILFFAFNGLYAQLGEKELFNKTEETLKKIIEEKPNGWEKKGIFTFLVNQSNFNNWAAGGQSSLSGNVNLNYDFNYKKDKWNWDNKLISVYGLTKIKEQEMQKTDDKLQYYSVVGKKVGEGYWFYSAFFSFKTQFDSGFDATTGIKTSHFFSPAYFQIGPGIMWKKSDNFKFNIAPITTKLILVHSHFTEFSPSFGVEQGSTTRVEFGASVSGYYKFNIMENVTAENILALYSNYLEKPQNIDIDYTLNIAMKINKMLSANFAFQTIYDDNAFAGFQVREVVGLGVNYGF